MTCRLRIYAGTALIEQRIYSRNKTLHAPHTLS